MSDRKYILPGMADWTLAVSDYGSNLWHKGGAGFPVNVNTSPQEIVEGLKDRLRGITATPDEAVFDAVLNIDWQAMLGPQPAFVAPLLNAAPTNAAQNNISNELIDELCEHLKAVYFPLQKIKDTSPELIDERCEHLKAVYFPLQKLKK